MVFEGMVLASAAVAEMPYDGIDQDGDGYDLVDVDGDGYASTLAGGGDCNDRDRRVHPDVYDVVGDHIDADCDGSDGGRRLPRLRPSVLLALLFCFLLMAAPSAPVVLRARRPRPSGVP